MYFIQYHPLKEKLRERTLSESEALPYWILFNVLVVLGFYVPTLGDFNAWDAIGGVMSLLFTICGIYHVYSQNGGTSGFDFIQKVVVLGWVVTIRCLLVFIPSMIVFYILFAEILMEGEISENTNLLDVMLNAAFYIIYFQRLGRHIQDTTKDKVEPPPLPPQY